MKNDHIVWGYADRQDGDGSVVLCGLTDEGLAYLKANPGHTLLIDPPGRGFANVTQVVVFAAKDKASLKELLQATGMAVSELH